MQIFVVPTHFTFSFLDGDGERREVEAAQNRLIDRSLSRYASNSAFRPVNAAERGNLCDARGLSSCFIQVAPFILDADEPRLVTLARVLVREGLAKIKQSNADWVEEALGADASPNTVALRSMRGLRTNGKSDSCGALHECFFLKAQSIIRAERLARMVHE